MPEFSLPDTRDGATVRSADFAGKPTVVVFVCNHCPFVLHILTEFSQFGNWCSEQNVGMVAISSNDVATYPADSPERMRALALEQGFRFPYLFDESQDVARAFDARCTPDLYVFDRDGALAYHGQFDDSRPGNGVAPSGDTVRRVVRQLLAGERPDGEQRQSVGCSIKWRA